jgi:magnesium chelatase subunit D
VTGQAHAPKPAPYGDAACAAALLAIDPAGCGGILLRSFAGPMRDEFLVRLREYLTPLRKIPLNISDDRLLGGLDLAATLSAGRPVTQRGILAEASGGAVVLAMAERLTREAAAKIATAMEGGFGVVALDEGDADEAAPVALRDRLAFMLDEAALAEAGPWPDAALVAGAKTRLSRVIIDAKVLESLCRTAFALGIGSIRASLLAVHAARAAAALAGRDTVSADDARLAAKLVLGPRAVHAPPAEQGEDQDAHNTQDEYKGDGADDADQDGGDGLDEAVLDAARALLPLDIFKTLTGAKPLSAISVSGGKSGDVLNARRGRPAGARPGRLGGGARLALVETLTAAAPWQKLRRDNGHRIIVRGDDFRVMRFRARARTVAIFAVDASGSAALNRLAEAKGAVLHLLAGCYARRDQVALIAFRGKGAECLLPPTHALARARRSLSALPGGGGTPLALGITAAHDLALAERRKGTQPLLILLTDGGANIGRDGKAGRGQAARDAIEAARRFHASGIPALLVDTSVRPQKLAQRLAEALDARYLPLPYADPALLSRAVRAAQS